MHIAKQGPDSLLFGGQGRASEEVSLDSPGEGWLGVWGEGGEVGKLSTV